jgi:hypothetical protein
LLVAGGWTADASGRLGTGETVRMRHLVFVVVALGLVAAACSREETPPASQAFCSAAERYNKELERTQLEGKASVERQLPLVADLADTAPKGIRQDTQTFLDALQRRADGDTSVVDDPTINEAVDNVNRYANKACNVYKRDSGI